MLAQVLFPSIILVTFCYQTLVNGNAPCKMRNVGGLVCVSNHKRLGDRSAYELKHLSCVQADKKGQKKVLMKEKPEPIQVKQYKEGRFVVTAQKGGQQALRQAYVFRKIQILVTKSCLSYSEDAVVHTSRRNTNRDQTVAGKGYRKLGFGNDTIYVKRYDITRSWDEAANICLSDSATLAKIDTKQKMKEIQSKVSKPKDQFRKFYMWIGLRDFHRKNSFTWVDGSPLVSSHWHSSQPSHAEKLSNGSLVDEDCVALVSYVFDGLYWGDKNCGGKHGFLCEINKM